MSTYDFIVYDGLNLHLSAFRPIVAAACDLDEIIEAVSTGSQERLVCTVHDAQSMIELLEDGHYWAGLNATQEALEDVHNLLNDYFV